MSVRSIKCVSYTCEFGDPLDIPEIVNGMDMVRPTLLSIGGDMAIMYSKTSTAQLLFLSLTL